MKDVTSAAVGTAPEKKFESHRKRFRSSGSEPSFIPNPHAPVVVLDEDGTISHLTKSARRLLEYDEDQHVETCFFSHVHGKNLYRVMRDIADMVCHRKESCSWLLRLRTGHGRWRWYKAAVKNYLDNDTPGIMVVVHDLHEW